VRTAERGGLTLPTAGQVSGRVPGPSIAAGAASAASAGSDERYRLVIEAVLIGGVVAAAVMLGSRPVWAWALDGIIGAVLVGLWLLRASAKGTLTLRRTRLDFPVIALLGLAVLSTVTSVYRYASEVETVRLTSYVLLYYVIVNNLDGRAAVRRILRTVVILGAVLSVYGLYEVMSGSEQVLWMPKPIAAGVARGVVTGTFGDGAAFGGLLTLIVPLSVSAALDGLSRRRWTEAGLYGLCAALTAAGLVGTLNRSSWLGTAVALALMAVVGLRPPRVLTEYKLGLAAGALACALIFAGTVSQPVINRFRAAFETGNSSIAVRYQYLLSSLHMMRDRPLLGFGPGTFEYAWRAYRLPRRASVFADAVYAHNEYAQLGAEMGVLAPLCVLWLIAAHLRAGFASGRGGTADWTAAGLTASPAGLAAANLTYFHWHVASTAILFWAILGLAHVWRVREAAR